MTPEERARRIASRPGSRIDHNLWLAGKIAEQTRPSTAQKYIQLVRVADELGQIIGPETPCTKGCAHCCHMAVGIMQHEAELIGQHIGRAPEKMPARDTVEETLEALHSNVGRFKGVRCTFLGDDNLCTIYEVRPLACRKHHVLEENSDKCRIGTEQSTAAIDLTPFDAAAATIGIHDTFGDIREYFP